MILLQFTIDNAENPLLVVHRSQIDIIIDFHKNWSAIS